MNTEQPIADSDPHLSEIAQRYDAMSAEQKSAAYHKRNDRQAIEQDLTDFRARGYL